MNNLILALSPGAIGTIVGASIALLGISIIIIRYSKRKK